MTSYTSRAGVPFTSSSVDSSTGSIGGVIASYRRSQFFASSNIPYNAHFSDEGSDEEARVGEDDEEGELIQMSRDDMTEFWDWDETSRPVLQRARTFIPQRPVETREITATSASQLARSTSDEAVPLLQASPTSNQVSYGGSDSDTYVGEESHDQTDRSILQRKSSGTLRQPHNYGGQSTYGQTLFNSIAILLGIGVLSEPLAFAYAGWIGGTALIVFMGFLNCYTAKILAGIILEDPHLRSYADIGRKAFGPKSTALTTIMFCLELFAVSVAFVTLAADSMHEIMPAYSSNTFKIASIVLLAPLVFLPLSMLSYTSIFGICSTLLIIAVVFIDGFSKPDAPGSLWSPAVTSWGTGSMTELGIAFGLFMAGFSGHAVVPSLARDMVDPSEFDNMINWAFIATTFIYGIIGYAGYFMFGRNVSDEVSKDLMNTPGYTSWINEIALWTLVSTPITKFPLSTRPLNIILEIMLGIDNHAPLQGGIKPQLDTQPSTAHRLLNRVFFIVERISVPVLTILVSILVPEFSSLMAFLGSFSAFMICVIGPISAKIALEGRCSLTDASFLAIAIVMATWGTLATFWAA
ncbi:transmembrane amino acid transporter protein-domain-containing protein [Suillus plorans]|uniref:Transmembrane amino acid transporter protein-domain-containing protein n=1 Tax=Suillus plorans TaxID=116603 RepID=A0A9P7J3Z9_9AGAM|nr:transmembrane amino acid transporter protein-domain-containing protein [Suillus plorans]KAG1801426.1 transmembrane amino acid transporter protein-domain-containing protein [Suillus plorans]